MPSALHIYRIDEINILDLITESSSIDKYMSDIINIEKLIIIIKERDIYLDKCFPQSFVEK